MQDQKTATAAATEIDDQTFWNQIKTRDAIVKANNDKANAAADAVIAFMDGYKIKDVKYVVTDTIVRVRVIGNGWQVSVNVAKGYAMFDAPKAWDWERGYAYKEAVNTAIFANNDNDDNDDDPTPTDDDTKTEAAEFPVCQPEPTAEQIELAKQFKPAREVGEVWKDGNEYKIQMPNGIHTTKLKRDALSWAAVAKCGNDSSQTTVQKAREDFVAAVNDTGICDKCLDDSRKDGAKSETEAPAPKSTPDAKIDSNELKSALAVIDGIDERLGLGYTIGEALENTAGAFGVPEAICNKIYVARFTYWKYDDPTTRDGWGNRMDALCERFNEKQSEYVKTRGDMDATPDAVKYARGARDQAETEYERCNERFIAWKDAQAEPKTKRPTDDEIRDEIARLEKQCDDQNDLIRNALCKDTAEVYRNTRDKLRDRAATLAWVLGE